MYFLFTCFLLPWNCRFAHPVQACVAPIVTKSSNYPAHCKSSPRRKKSFATFMVSGLNVLQHFLHDLICIHSEHQPINTIRRAYKVLKYRGPYECGVVHERCLFCGQDGLAQGTRGTVHLDGLREATVSARIAYSTITHAYDGLLSIMLIYLLCDMCICFLAGRVVTSRWTFTERGLTFRTSATRPRGGAFR